MTDPSARLLRLLSLLQAPGPRSGLDLADRLGVDPRTVRRDVDKLRRLGYPVEAVPGIAGYRLGAGTALPPLLLDDDEAVAVAVGLGTATGGITGIEEASVRALAKLSQVLPSRLRHRVRTLTAATVTLRHPGAAVDAAVLTEIATAIGRHERLRFDYVTHSGSETRRDIEPARLVHSGRAWYLLGYDVDRSDWRTFRVDRVRPRTPTGPRFTPRDPPTDVADHTAAGITTRVYRHRARFTLHVGIERAAEHFAPTVAVLEALDEHRCTMTVGSDSLDELLLYVSTAGFDFEVHEPPELVAHVPVVMERLRRAVGA